jgi:hypothetical protein
MRGMSGLKFSARAALVALVMLVASSQIALANTTTLVCAAPSAAWPTLNVELNEAKGTATLNWGAHAPYPGGAIMPAYSVGPLTATFDTKSVTFDNNANNGHQHFVIDRMRASVTIYGSGSLPFDQTPSQDRFVNMFDCQIGKAKF